MRALGLVIAVTACSSPWDSYSGWSPSHSENNSPSTDTPLALEPESLDKDPSLLVLNRQALRASEHAFARRFDGIGSGAQSAMRQFFLGFESPLAYAEPDAREPVVENYPRQLRGELFEMWPGGRCAAADCDIGDAEEAPFTLVSIVNRIDLAQDACSGSAGELRFIYTGLVAQTKRTQPFNIIFEYRIPETAAVWAKQVETVTNLGQESPRYRSALATLTQRIATPDNLIAVRTNEIVLSKTWSMREFRMREGQLAPMAVAETPALGLNRTSSIDALIEKQERVSKDAPNEIAVAIRAGEVTIPDEEFQWEGFRGPLKNGNFSRRTCNGCHGGDRPTGENFAFQQVGFPAPYYSADNDTVATVSDYLREELPVRRRAYKVALDAICTERSADANVPDGGADSQAQDSGAPNASVSDSFGSTTRSTRRARPTSH
jgi:hypothetical protein